MRYSAYVLCALLLTLGLPFGAPSARSAPDPSSPDQIGWVVMPAGTRPTYMGIHGGTMPVSLLVSGDGTSLVTFVGRTGNDFLEMLRRTDLPMPSLLNATSRTAPGNPGALPAANATMLTAGTPASSMPVFNIAGENLWHMDISPGQMQPFGLSDKPLSIEGQVARPQHLSPAKQYRLFFQPQYLQPRRGNPH